MNSYLRMLPGSDEKLSGILNRIVQKFPQIYFCFKTSCIHAGEV